MTEKKKSIYETLSKINVKPYLNDISGIAKKSGKRFTLYYLSWATAMDLVKKFYPDANYEVREYDNWQKLSDGSFQKVGTLDYRITNVGCEVEVTAIIDGQRFTQKLYPMDRNNNPIMRPNIKDINKAQLRCLVKALAFAGLGLEVYAGEDLPKNKDEIAVKPSKATQNKQSNSSNFESKGVSKWSSEYLSKFEINIRDKEGSRKVPMWKIVKSVVAGDQATKQLVDSLKGLQADVYLEAFKRGLDHVVEKESA